MSDRNAPRRVGIEICCGSADDVVEAEAGGADRAELNSALFLGGLTPSLGVFEESRRRASIPILPMLRPRAGGFHYSEAEAAAMERDARHFLEAGADGLVFGFLHENGEIDTRRCERLIRVAGEAETVFHRAFDVTPDPFAALEQLISLGFTRALTSGQENTALEGAGLIRRLIERAHGRIELLPGAGVKPHNVEDLVRRTGCAQVHLSAFSARRDSSTVVRPHIHFGGALRYPEHEYQATDRSKVRSMTDALRKIEGKD